MTFFITSIDHKGKTKSKWKSTNLYVVHVHKTNWYTHTHPHSMFVVIYDYYFIWDHNVENDNPLHTKNMEKYYKQQIRRIINKLWTNLIKGKARWQHQYYCMYCVWTRKMNAHLCKHTLLSLTWNEMKTLYFHSTDPILVDL